MNELTEIAILAYRNARYRDAIELLLQVTDSESGNWLARMYLAMSYEKSGRITDAHRLFKRVAAACPDELLRTKAENALPLIEAEMRRRFQKDTVVSKKNSNVSDDEELHWVATN